MAHLLHRERVQVAESQPRDEEDRGRPDIEGRKPEDTGQAECERDKRQGRGADIGQDHDPPHPQPHHEGGVDEGPGGGNRGDAREPQGEALRPVIGLVKDLLDRGQ